MLYYKKIIIMKKGLFLSLLVASGCFLSCQGHKNADAVMDEERIEMAPNEVETMPVYKVVDGLIKPENGRPMIVDFSATWCPPCKQLKPIFEKLAEEFKGRIDFVTVDVDENPELSQAYGVQSIPMLVFLNKDGQIQQSLVGFQNRDQILGEINTYFGF